MIKELLPIGSVVLLNNAKKRLMICGIKQAAKEDPDKEFDYMGVFYPEGAIGENYNFLFNHEDIVEVFFKGFEDVERQNFIENLSKYYDEQK